MDISIMTDLEDERDFLRKRVAEIEAENEHLKKSQKITIHPPAITESEVIKHLQDFLKAEREERFRLEAELEHQRQLYADHIGDEHDNCGVAVNQRLQAENDRLRKAIYTAPHTMGCQCLQGGPTLPHWGKIEFCDCWKKAALEVDGEKVSNS